MRFQDLPIKRKLVVVIFLTSLLVLSFTSLVLLTYEIYSFKQTTSRSLSTMADIIAANSSAALIFDNHEIAREILSGLRAEPEVVAAALYNRDGRLYVTYPTNLNVAALPALPASDGVTFRWRNLTLFKPVLQGQSRVGTLFLRADLHEMYRRLGVYGTVLLLVLVGSGMFALFLSNFFQQKISLPLLGLAATAKTVSEKKDYSVRAHKISQDEVGYLTEAFNSMLDQIQTSHSALRESETRLSGVFNQAGAGIAQCDLTGRFLLVNDRYCEITGHKREYLLKMRMQDITFPADLADSNSALADLITGSTGKILEKRYVRPNGEIVWARASVVPLRDEHGKVESALSVAQDITERKRAEQELERSRDAAERANRAKDEFLAALSHELRTPLNPVLLLASEAAENPGLSAEVRAQFTTIRNNVELEARLIDDLLDVTRITHGKLPLNKARVDVHTLLREALVTVQAELQQKQIVLTMDFAAEQSIMSGDAVRLQQVFWNVLKNAVKFTPAGGRVCISTRATPEEMVIAIADSGIGMTPGELTRIFEAFTQGDHAGVEGSHRFGGLGLGLAISRKLVESHAGRIQASSAGTDQGATFIIHLPFAAEFEDEVPSAGSGSPSSQPNNQSKGITILLVEDHEPTRTALEQLLARRHYQVKSAGSVAEARSLWESSKFQVLISDIGLPDGTGFELMKLLRARQQDLRGIALTGYGMEEDVARSLEAGFVSHLTKPIRVQSLESALAAALKTESNAKTG